MSVKPRFVQFLTSVSVAAMFIATPLAVKFDGTVGFTVVTTAAFAQGVPVDLPGGPDGPFPDDMPGGPLIDCVGDCGPPTDPVDLIDPPLECEFDCGPPTDPVDPPTDPIDPIDPPQECEVDCGPPTDPIVLPIDECDQKDAPDSCFDPEPVATPSPSDDDDDEPANPPVADIPDVATPKQDGLEFVETLLCQTACTASVTTDGEVTVTVTSTTTAGDTVETTIKQDGPEVETQVVVKDTIKLTALEKFETKTEARNMLEKRVAAISAKLKLNVDFAVSGDRLRDSSAIADSLVKDISGALNISLDRFLVTQSREG